MQCILYNAVQILNHDLVYLNGNCAISDYSYHIRCEKRTSTTVAVLDLHFETSSKCYKCHLQSCTSCYVDNIHIKTCHLILSFVFSIYIIAFQILLMEV
ncbi:hypothetical protein T4B_1373 [Trichinella pseudospiralis]|uniref:Uncharacterized protein n=1 Tax=Trichinella pseudospiralis TaxID=6337 RepID=A0A0V1HKY4_TRIPS|nr:hypothetical protein T4A_7632 [Trichinella pseudospiralis]KRZ11105.1 hypothetical protein T4B_1373 [Trichinella pseudospiralis]